MEVTSGAEEGFVREWTPCSHILNLIPPRIQTGLFSNELCLTCVDAVSEYIALGTNVGLVYWYDRKKGNIQRLRCEASNSPITYVKIVSTVDYMVGAGNAAGQVTVFQIPKEHPENVPDTFKPKVEPKVERYTIGDLHKSKITAIEWSKNGMRLFSGDKNGVIIMTEIDFYMHLCKSMEIVNEEHEIVQMSYCQGALLVSSLYRTIICERRDARWHVSQLGKKERRSLCALGAVFHYSYARGGGPAAYCARPGLRVWRADRSGDVLQTLLFKEAISNPLTVAELLNPAQRRRAGADRELQLGPLHVFREHFLVAHNDRVLYVLDPRTLTAVAVVDDLRGILSVSVNKDEIFILEGPRSLIRLAHTPEPAALAPDEPPLLMSKSLSSSLQQAVNTVRDLAHLDHTVPYIASVLEQPISMFARHETVDTGVANAEECFELPPMKRLPSDVSEAALVLPSIGHEFERAPADAAPRRASDDLRRKLSLIAGKEEELIHSSRRARRRSPLASPAATPLRRTTPSAPPAPLAAPAPPVSYTSPCLMDLSVYGNLPQESDDALERQIEEKEKILAKMLNLDSFSIKSPAPAPPPTDDDLDYRYESPHDPPKETTVTGNTEFTDKKEKSPVKEKKNSDKPSIVDLVPKVVKLPNTWNLENIELRLDMRNGLKNGVHGVISPDDNIDSDWEVI